MATNDTLLEMEIDLAVKAVAAVRIGADGQPAVERVEVVACRILGSQERSTRPENAGVALS